MRCRRMSLSPRSCEPQFAEATPKALVMLVASSFQVVLARGTGAEQASVFAGLVVQYQDNVCSMSSCNK